MLLEIEHLSKRYGRGPLANDDVSLSVAAGEVYGLLGHNGAGKTTLVNQVIGLLRPTAGTIRLAGGDPVADPAFARRECALQPQSHIPLNGVTPREAVETIARIRGAGARQARAATATLLEELDIAGWAGKPGERLSGGVRRLTAFCMAAVRPGRLIILDEPTNDVDPVRRRLMWAVIRKLADDDRAVLVVTHNVTEAEHYVDRLSILDSGRVVVTGSPAQLCADGRSLEDVYIQLAGAEADDALVA